jgi:hypothetical protein
MKINNLEYMESVVNKNDSLKWNGWNILFLEEDPMAYMNKNALFHMEKWYKTTTIENIDGYWKIPRSVIKKINV